MLTHCPCCLLISRYFSALPAVYSWSLDSFFSVDRHFFNTRTATLVLKDAVLVQPEVGMEAAFLERFSEITTNTTYSSWTGNRKFLIVSCKPVPSVKKQNKANTANWWWFGILFLFLILYFDFSLVSLEQLVEKTWISKLGRVTSNGNSCTSHEMVHLHSHCLPHQLVTGCRHSNTRKIHVAPSSWNKALLFSVRKQDFSQILTSQSKYGLHLSVQQCETILHASRSVKNFQAAVWKFKSTVYLICNCTFPIYREKQ